MTLRPSLVQKQGLKLRQIISPKIIQTLKTFQMSLQDLVESLETEAQTNVLLEIDSEDSLKSFKPSSTQTTEGLSQDTPVFNTKSLYDELMLQLELEHLPKKEHVIAKALIEELDDRGFIPHYPQVKEKLCRTFQVTERKVHDVLKIIQSFEPEGVGARDLKECLLIQLEHHQLDSDKLKTVLKTVISKHLDLLAENPKKLATLLNIEPEGVDALSVYIKNNFSPNPGAAYTTSSTRFVVPSFRLELHNQTPVLIPLEKQLLNQVHLSKHYENLLLDPATDEATKQYLQDQHNKATALLEQLQERIQKLNELVTYILNIQHDFCLNGPAYLKPLLQQEVAQNLGLSNSTVSRILSSKYIETPYGHLLLKTLCPRRTFGKTSIKLKELIKDLIQKNPKWSDQKLANTLHEEGISISRRTLAKYRASLNIQSSYKRES